MKLTTLAQALMITGGMTNVGVSTVSAEAQQIPSSAVACYLVGRVYFDSAGNAQVAGYFSERLMHEDPVALDAVASVGQLC